MRLGWMTAAAILAAGGAAAKMVTPGMDRSWGKPGVTLEAYRADGLACAREAAATDLSKTDPARALVIASRLVENDPTIGAGAMIDPMGSAQAGGDPVPSNAAAGIVQNIGPGRQILKAGDIMKARLESCLVRLGYAKFRLTGAQRKRLRGLPEGSDARRAYLHGLASDPVVLARQKLD
ncbi:MAG: hypothetical protein JO013_02550 [Alphaproteobacteria bacterium]|nr:hypothetical protein [Alphaproteobacteria bacterium]